MLTYLPLIRSNHFGLHFCFCLFRGFATVKTHTEFSYNKRTKMYSQMKLHRHRLNQIKTHSTRTYRKNKWFNNVKQIVQNERERMFILEWCNITKCFIVSKIKNVLNFFATLPLFLMCLCCLHPRLGHAFFIFFLFLLQFSSVTGWIFR